MCFLLAESHKEGERYSGTGQDLKLTHVKFFPGLETPRHVYCPVFANHSCSFSFQRGDPLQAISRRPTLLKVAFPPLVLGQTAGQQRNVEFPIEHGGLGFLPIKDLAAIARLSVLASLPSNTLKAGTGAPGMGHWLYTPTAPFTKVANGPFKWGLQHYVASNSWEQNSRAGHRWTILGRHVAWCARRAKEIRHNRLRDFLLEYTKTTGAIATSEQAMPLPRDNHPATWETRAVHTVDIHISEPNGTDVRIGMAKPDCNVPKELARMEQEKRREYGLGQANPSTLFDGVVPVIFEQHGCPSPCAITLGSHLTHGVSWMIASRGLYAPISCTLLAMHYQMFQECCPIVKQSQRKIT